VKTRLGFEDDAVFDTLLPIFAKHSIDLLTVHGRTVAQMYRSEVDYKRIAEAVAAMPCPVLANGNVSSALKAGEILQHTGARGLMIGRGAIRNPWMFGQIRSHLCGEAFTLPLGRDVLAYIHDLYETVTSPEAPEVSRVHKLKKYLNFLGLGVEPTGAFLHQMRRTRTKEELFRACAELLDHAEPMPLEPFDLGLKACDVMAGAHL
jgi:tRNA-dihydrouridine synthase B